MSPVAHSGISILGWKYFSREKNYKTFFLFLILANFSDIDFIINFFLPEKIHIHQLYTHNVFFILFTVLIIALFFKDKSKREWLGLFLVGYSHLLLDLLVIDKAPPIGIRLFYPLSRESFNIGVFPHLLRGNLAEIFSLNNLLILILEAVLFLLPLVFLFREDIAQYEGRLLFWKK